MELNEERSYTTLEEVTKLLLAARGKTFRELDETGRGDSAGNKGSLGNIIEESVLHYPVNSDREADILVGDKRYELKVTPLIHRGKTGKKISAKERLVIDIINYLKLPAEDFDGSTFWEKARRMIVVYYYDDRTDRKHQSRLDCKVLGAFSFEYEENDLATIREDWQFIHDKVTNGYANLLSESDTSYLAACTKGQNAAKSLRPSPAPAGSLESTVPAKQRAFSYKQSYMTRVANRILGRDKGVSRLSMAANQSLNEYIQEKTGKYIGKTVGEITQMLGLPDTTAKNANSILALRMLGTSEKSIRHVDQLAAANVSQLKTVVLYKNQMPQESMSFKALTEGQWKELGDSSVTWHDSFIYQFFETNKFLMMVFEASGNSRKDSGRLTDVFKECVLWNMPEKDIEKYVYPVWREVHNLLLAGASVCYDKKDEKNKLPGQNFNKVFHFRPHGRNAADTVQLPNREIIPKQSFWLDRRYIGKIFAGTVA
ncbi:Sau3AI family type II restriction endonuclease [Bifidobacterium sp. ESL0790]|uniref:Sau3AI family type II restriction endonuclease n=1 Tax=Bifidobacterium sp. ESL0790 TaxID=2983233 RepID=UPI0023F86CBE|nr:Sau3AI family type II restriction endonuclease [Bifidobacterium sp. ESL0790]WEV72758.1 Sau3AI family type II restriction endonuclease [Bifidobacterium sp. ESL0790]